MFDGIQSVWKSVDLRFSIELAKAILPYRPHWLEEPLRPDDLEGYTRLKGETGITLAAGEHWYTRWNVKPFLDHGLVSFVQSDPEWCGGISEWLKICELTRGYPGVQVIPHGHHVLAASACVASQSETLCPMMEYLYQSRVGLQHCQTRPLTASAGSFARLKTPGLAPRSTRRGLCGSTEPQCESLTGLLEYNSSAWTSAGVGRNVSRPPRVGLEEPEHEPSRCLVRHRVRTGPEPADACVSQRRLSLAADPVPEGSEPASRRLPPRAPARGAGRAEDRETYIGDYHL